jgi:uncharacterized protein YbdZ (MbtH family)
MKRPRTKDRRTHHGVVHNEERDSIRLHGHPIPAGRMAVDRSGLKADCDAYIEEV